MTKYLGWAVALVLAVMSVAFLGHNAGKAATATLLVEPATQMNHPRQWTEQHASHGSTTYLVVGEHGPMAMMMTF